MPHTPAFRLSFALVLVGGLVAVNCSVNDSGLGGGGANGAATGGRGTGGVPTAATGGRTGSGGIPAPPMGTGGAPSATGGVGTGGEVGSGGITATGGASATGGQAVGTGGTTPGTGGDPGASGGVIGSSTGGMTTPPGTGGAMMPGTGGATGACNATTCPNGCCSLEGRCVAGTGNARCGKGGGTCVDCGSCLTCETGTCTLIPTSRWEVICVSANIAPTKPNGTPWDSSGTGLPDPICRSVTPNGVVEVSTNAETDTLSPMWDEPITPTSISGGGGRVTAAALMSGPNGLPRWGISVVDNDSNGAGNEVVCAVAPRLVATDFPTGVISLPAVGSCLNLTIRLECAE